MQNAANRQQNFFSGADDTMRKRSRVNFYLEAQMMTMAGKMVFGQAANK
jgi:hypothetical protein